MFAAVLLAAVVAQTQAAGTFVVRPNTPLVISFDQQAAADNVYRWGCVSTNTAIPSPAPVTIVPVVGATVDAAGRKRHTADVPGLPTGVYGCAVAVSNPFTVQGKLPEVASDPIAVLTGNLPDKPVNLLLVVK